MLTRAEEETEIMWMQIEKEFFDDHIGSRFRVVVSEEAIGTARLMHV